jgi:hypothetical protein
MGETCWLEKFRDEDSVLFAVRTEKQLLKHQGTPHSLWDLIPGPLPCTSPVVHR